MIEAASVVPISDRVSTEGIRENNKTESEHRIRKAAVRVGAIIGKTTLVCLVVTPFSVYTGMRIVDYMNETSVRTLRDGMDQQNGTLTQVKENINDGVSVDVNLPPAASTDNADAAPVPTTIPAASEQEHAPTDQATTTTSTTTP